MAKKNLSADKGGKVISSTSTSLVTTNSEHGKNRKITSKVDLTEEEKKEMLEKFKPSGDFEKDFVELGALVGFPSICVTPRPKRPSTPHMTPPDTSMNKKATNPQNPDPVKVMDTNQQKPTTYLIQEDKYQYFKPKIEIETEEEGNKSHIKELYIRGWKVDERVVEILTLTMPELDKLTLVNLWNTGLTDETLVSLHKCLSLTNNLKTLVLDANSHVESQRFDIFLTEKTSIQNLSLKNCQLTDIGGMYIGEALAENKSLLTLNLAFNKLTQESVYYIAKGLKTNRHLLSLNLASNNIDDDGANFLAETLSTFPLTHEQVIARRMLKQAQLNSEDGAPYSPNHSTSHERPPTASRSFSKEEKNKKDKGSKKKDTSSNKSKDSAVKRGSSNVDATKNQKNQKVKSSSKQDRTKTPFADAEDSYEFRNPLLEKATEIDGELWITGNRALINLNLARNMITEKGLEKLYTAVKYQAEGSNDSSRTNGTGLMRLSLQKNAFPSVHQTYNELVELVKTRDPFYKPPTPQPIEENIKGET